MKTKKKPLKNILKPFLSLFIIICCTTKTYSQKKENTFFDVNQILSDIFSNISTNNDNQLLIEFKNNEYKYFMQIDNRKAIISTHTKKYKIKDSIKLIQKEGMNLIIKRHFSNYWFIEKTKKDKDKKRKKYDGGFRIINDTAIKPLNKKEFLQIKNK